MIWQARFTIKDNIPFKQFSHSDDQKTVEYDDNIKALITRVFDLVTKRPVLPDIIKSKKGLFKSRLLIPGFFWFSLQKF